MNDPVQPAAEGQNEPGGRFGLGDLHSHRLMYLKAALLLGVGVVSSVLLLVENPGLRNAFLLAAAVWGFCRAYYFAFYVIEQYIDPGYRFAGLWAFARYLLRDRKQTPPRSPS